MPAGKSPRFGFRPAARAIEADGRAAEDGPRGAPADRAEAFQAAAARSGAVARRGAGDGELLIWPILCSAQRTKTALRRRLPRPSHRPPAKSTSWLHMAARNFATCR